MGGAEPAVTLSEAQAYVRVETGEEEALLAGLIRTASALCEAFFNQVVIARPFQQVLVGTGAWQPLQAAPVRAIIAVEQLSVVGAAEPIASDAYAVDIDQAGEGWIRLGAGTRVRVTGEAGLATDCNGVPEPLRQGVLRLVAHLFANRDGSSGEPPAAVTALWRPYRRLRLR